MVNEAYKLYVISNSEEDYDNLQLEKRKLQETYDQIENEKIEKIVKEIENANQMAKHAKYLKLINDMPWRKSAKKGIIKEDNNEERINKWSIILEIFSVE